MYRLLILAFVAVATAEVTHDGPCPDIKPVANFNVTAYQGTWYEIKKFANEAEKNGKCASAEYVLDGDVVKVTNRHVVGKVQATVTGTAKFAPDANNAGKLLVSLNFGVVNGRDKMHNTRDQNAGLYLAQKLSVAIQCGNAASILGTLPTGNGLLEMSREQPLNVIATDYANYAIAYSCKYDDKKKTHSDSIWILSRAKKLEGDAKTAVDNFLKDHAKEIDSSKLVTTDFSEEACKFDSTTTVKEPAKH